MKASTKIVVVLGIVVLLGTAAIIAPSVPGTMIQNRDGDIVWGTGVVRHYYKAAPAQPKLVERYSRGRLARSEWFKPDGTLILATDWTHDGQGWGLFLREDGSVRTKMHFKNHLAEESTKSWFDPAGNEVTKEAFSVGEESNWGRPGPAEGLSVGRIVKSAR